MGRRVRHAHTCACEGKCVCGRIKWGTCQNEHACERVDQITQGIKQVSAFKASNKLKNCSQEQLQGVGCSYSRTNDEVIIQREVTGSWLQLIQDYDSITEAYGT